MKNYLLAGTLFLLSVTSCQQKETEQAEEIIEEKIELSASNKMTVNGIIHSIENGKDGYMATIETNEGQIYVVTISIVNLQKSGNEFKRYEVRNKIEVSGEFWEDASGVKHITAEQVKAF